MSDIPSLKSKINDLKAKVEQDSISPSYLGALLDDIIDTLDTKNNSPASSSADGKMSAADKRRLDATEGIVTFDDMVDGVHLNTSSPSIPAGDEVDNRQSTAPDGCELVYSSSDSRFYARKAKAGGGYTWFFYPQNRDVWGEPNPEVNGKGVLARAGYVFLCRNLSSPYNGEIFTARYVDHGDNRKTTKLFRLTSVSEFNKAVADLLTRNGAPRVRINRGNLDVFVDRENCRLTFAGEGFGVSVDGTDGGFVWLANEPRTACTRFAFDSTDSTKFLAVDLQADYPKDATGFRRGSLTQLVKGITLNQLRTGRYLPVAYVYRASEHGSHIALLGEFADIYGNPTTEREIRRTAFADVESAYMQGNARRFAPANGSTAWFGRLRLLHVSDVHEHWAEFQEALEVGQEFADIVVDTGDMLSTDAPDKLASYGAAIANSLRPVIAARGNHDARVSKSNGTLQGPTAAQWFADVHSKMPSGFVQPDAAVAAKRCYGYRDITPNATAGTFRIIMLDPQDCAEPSLWCYAYFSPEQVQWLISTLTDAMSKGYHVITMMHYSFGEADSPEWSEVHDGGPARADATFLQGPGMIPDIIDAMQHGTALSRTYASSKSGYAAVTVNIAARTDTKRLDFVAHLFGHIHTKAWHWCECGGKKYDILMLCENALALDGVALNVSPHIKGRPNALSCSVLNIDPLEKAIYRVSYGSYLGFNGMARERVTRLPYRRSAGADATTPATLGDLAALPKIPSPQSKRTATAADKMYVYSVNDPESKMSVLNAPDTQLVRSNGKLRFQKGIWNPVGESLDYTRNEVPCATPGCDGAMAKEDKARVDAIETVAFDPLWTSAGGTIDRSGHASAPYQINGVYMTEANARRTYSLLPLITRWIRAFTVDEYDGQYNVKYGDYNYSTGFFEAYSTLTNITPAQAEKILQAGEMGKNITCTTRLLYADVRDVRTLPPLAAYPGASKSDMTWMFSESAFEVLMFKKHRWNNDAVVASEMDGAFRFCRSVKKIIGIINVASVTTGMATTFYACDVLESVQLKGLQCNLFIGQSPKLSLASLQYLVTNASASIPASAPITVTVHADVYAKLTDTAQTDWHAVLTAAAAKNIAFALA